MLGRRGITLIEIMVVLVIIGICAAIAFPDYTANSEQAMARTAKNNLLSIYSAETNFSTNNGAYATSVSGSAGDPNGVQNVNNTFSLNLVDDNSYQYACVPDVTGFSCTATRNSPSVNIVMAVKNLPIQLDSNNPNPNPSCSGANAGWCP